MKKLVFLIVLLILSFPQRIRAETINYSLLYEWSLQPAKIQYNLAKDSVSIMVVNSMPDTYLSETWAVTNTYVYPGTNKIINAQILLLPGHEDCLTHEVGHCVSHFQKTAFFWVENSIWVNIYMQEAHNQMIFPQGWDNAYEYFACSYEEYLRFPKYMKQLQPLTYNYMQVVFSYQ